jgi:hypothetical protein
VTDRKAKADVIQAHFEGVIGRGDGRTRDLNWDELNFEEPDLSSLGDYFSEEEVKNMVSKCPTIKSLSIWVQGQGRGVLQEV